MELLTVYNYILDEHMRHLQRNHMNHHHGHLWQPWKDCRQHQARLDTTRLTTKELPTTKWRRDRRNRVSSEYHHSSPSSSPNAVKPLSESNSSNSPANSPNGFAGAAVAALESPLDMSVSANKPPPPPYREPLPGSQFVHHQQQTTHVARPSVITQAPKRDSIASNQENNRVDAVESISMIDPVIDEHFRRSLGADYAILFGNKKPGAAVKPTPIVGAKKPSPVVSQQFSATTVAASAANTALHHSPSIAVATVSPIAATPLALFSPTSRISTSPSTSAAIVVKVEPQPARQPAPPAERRPSDAAAAATAAAATAEDSAVSMSVDDHFAKALGGDTWKQLKRAESRHDDALC